jgi:2-polyprenyl-6-methoxyphenol hydroxylase-like FAD-dependent oxidoreductase
MNVGIQDVHNLIHKLNTLKVNTEMASRKETELLRYGQERKEIDRKYLELGRAGYQTSLDIARELGFNPQYLSIANAFSFLPFKKNIFTYMTKTLFKPRPVTKRIKMFENE